MTDLKLKYKSPRKLFILLFSYCSASEDTQKVR